MVGGARAQLALERRGLEILEVVDREYDTTIGQGRRRNEALTRPRGKVGRADHSSAVEVYEGRPPADDPSSACLRHHQQATFTNPHVLDRKGWSSGVGLLDFEGGPRRSVRRHRRDKNTVEIPPHDPRVGLQPVKTRGAVEARGRNPGGFGTPIVEDSNR